jgi:hypothetical protein
MRGKIKHDVSKLRAEWPQEKRKHLVDAAKSWVTSQGTVMTADQQVTVWYDYYANAAEKVLDDLAAEKFSKSSSLEQQRQMREVSNALRVGQGQWARTLAGEPAQRAYAQRCYDRYQDGQRTYEDDKAWEVFAGAVKTSVGAVERDYDLAERERIEAAQERQRQEAARIAKLVKGNDPRDLAFALLVDQEIGGTAGGDRVICQLLAPGGQSYRASTSEAVGCDPNAGIPLWILSKTEKLMSKPKGGLRSVLSCTEFKCLIRYMNAAGIDDSAIDEDSSEGTVRTLLGAGGYTIAREVKGRNHTPKVACLNCQQWLALIGWSWADGYG